MASLVLGKKKGLLGGSNPLLKHTSIQKANGAETNMRASSNALIWYLTIVLAFNIIDSLGAWIQFEVACPNIGMENFVSTPIMLSPGHVTSFDGHSPHPASLYYC